jgi:hypothetical protein
MRRCWRKLTTHDIYDVAELFSLADKCTRAMPGGQMRQGDAWHTPPAPEAGKCGKPHVSVVVQGSGSKNKKNNKKKTGGNNQPLARAPTAAAAATTTGGGQGPEVTSAPVKRLAATVEVTLPSAQLYAPQR